MCNIITVDSGSITEEVFLNNIWSEFYYSLKKNKDIILNMQKCSFIDSKVIVKLCCLGEIAKKNKINVKIIPSKPIYQYLYDIGFWNIISKYKIFDFDEINVSINNRETKATNAFFCLEKNELIRKFKNKFEFADWVDDRTKCKFYIKAELVGEGNTVSSSTYSNYNLPKNQKAVLKTISHFSDYTEYASEDRILDSIVELVHNSVWHSEGLCFFLVQSCTFKKSYQDFLISVSDTGIGLFESLRKKTPPFEPKTMSFDSFSSLESVSDKNKISLIEALVFRKESSTRGLYNIMQDLANEPKGIKSSLSIINGDICFRILKDKLYEFVNGDIEVIEANEKELIRMHNYIGNFLSIDIKLEKKLGSWRKLEGDLWI